MTQPYDQIDEVVAAGIAAADLAFDDPDAPLPYEPHTYEAARAAVERLAVRFEQLPGTARRIVDQARQGGEMLSSDRLQGLSEIAQNAEDVGATHLTFRLAGSELTATHNGLPVALNNVLALSMPWMTTKSSETEALGRFGIGLTTLRSISPTLEVFCWPYAIRIDGSLLTSLDLTDEVKKLVGDGTSTSLRLALYPDAPGAKDIVRWLEEWGDSALLFCQNLADVSFETSEGTLKSLHLKWNKPRPIQLELDERLVKAVKRRATPPDERSWVRWTSEVNAPQGLSRRHKKTGTTMPIGVAIPLHEESRGRIYAGLPLIGVEAPVAVNAHFDPTTGRQSLIENDWNAHLTGLVADLWVEVMLDMFLTKPRLAWRLMPLLADPEVLPTGALEKALIERARKVLPERIVFNTDTGELALSATAHEDKLLEGVLTEGQIAKLAGTSAALPHEARDNAGMWRRVLADWLLAGAPLAPTVTVSDALPLLDEEIEISQAVALAAAAISSGLEARLMSHSWLSDHYGQRFPPPTHADVWAFTTTTDQWAVELGLARQIHPDTLNQGEVSDLVVTWLHRTGALTMGDPGAHLERLSAVGKAGHRMSAGLSEEQLHSIRDAVEALPAQKQQEFGLGIGQAVLIEAFEYTAGGKRIRATASPTEVYLPKAIDREPGSFAVAAGVTPGILWAASKYAQVLRSQQGRAGLGPQKFLRLLGAEIAPRLTPHSELERRYANDARLGLPKYVAGGPSLRVAALSAIPADYTLEDYDSPDLEAILSDIAGDRGARRRRSRATALVSSLGRAWDRLGDRAEVVAATTDYGWQVRGSIESFWIWRTRGTEWLDNSRGIASAPHQLRLRTPATEAVHGPNSDDYLHREIPAERKDILTALGVAGEPTMTAMVDSLVQLRDMEAVGEGIAVARTTQLYRGIAGQVGPRRRSHGHLSAAQLRAIFSAGIGLIRTEQGWRRPSQVLAGTPVFGHFRAFVPHVEEAEPLWGALEVSEPSWRDCVEVLRSIAELDEDEEVGVESIELDTLRLLASLLDAEPLSGRSRAPLAKLALRTSLGRASLRPVFILSDQVVAEAVASSLPIWQPGGELDQFSSLVGPLEVTQLGPEHIQITGTENAIRDGEATELFRAAVAQLREDLIRNEPRAATALTIDWSDLESFDVLTVEQLISQVTPPKGLGRTVSGSINAYADPDQVRIYITDLDRLDGYDSGARAVASLFSSDHRRIAQAWLAACATARDGREARHLELAALQAEEAKRQQARAQTQLADLQAETSAKPTVRIRRQATATPGTPEPSEAKPRRLVDPGELVVLNPQGEVVGGEAVTRKTRRSKPLSKGLATVRNDAKPLRSHASPREYTEIDKETVALDVVRAVLRSSDADLVDLRSQRGVGADAVDELARFYELKVYEGDEPDQVRLEPSQIERAKSTEGFFLVVVSNVEDGHGNTKVRIITDPLNHLERVETRAVSFSGVKSVVSLIYELAPAGGNDSATLDEEDNA